MAAWLAPLPEGLALRELTNRAARATPVALEQQVLELDRAESDAVLAARRAVHDLVDDRLGGNQGLESFRALAQGLTMAAEHLRALAADSPEAGLPAATTVAEAAAEATDAAAAQAAAAAGTMGSRASSETMPAQGRPRSAALLAVAGVLLAAVTGVAAAALAAVSSVRSNAGAIASGGPQVTSKTAPLGADLTTTASWGVGIGALLGVGWAVAAHRSGRRGEDRTTAQEETAPTAQSARDRLRSQGIEAAVKLRRRRAARGALAVVNDERRRLDALRGSVLAAQRDARDHLARLRVTAGEVSDNDDYARLFDPPTLLHAALVPAADLPALWQGSQEVRDESLWAARLLGSAYARGGHREDLPFAPGAPWQATLRQQHDSLLRTGVFEWPQLGPHLQEQVRRFLADVPQALRMGVRPRQPDGTPVSLQDVHQLLLVVPPEGRSAVDRALAGQHLPDAVVLNGARGLSRLLVLRTAGEFDTTSLGKNL